jgi:hypothetical protein
MFNVNVYLRATDKAYCISDNPIHSLSRIEKCDILIDMQGLLDRPPRAALPREAPPEIRFAKTETALGGGGAFIHIVVSGDRPLKYTDPDGKWFLIDDLIMAIYLKAKTNSNSSVWELTVDTFKHSWQHPIEHGMFIKAVYDSLRDITIPVHKDFEVNLNTDVNDRKFKFSIRNRKRNNHIPSDEEISKQIDDLIKKQTGGEIHEE